jgi:hypothetical protein
VAIGDLQATEAVAIGDRQGTFLQETVIDEAPMKRTIGDPEVTRLRISSKICVCDSERGSGEGRE